MEINKKKSGILVISKRKNNLNNIEINSNIRGYPYVSNYKYLGVTFSKKLSPQLHLDKMEEKLKKYKKFIMILKL